MPIKRALLSVSDKTGIVEFARKLHEAGVEIISTGGTMKAIDDAGIPVTYVSDVTKFPEIMDGRVKTLNPYIHGGILAVRDNQSHVAQMQKFNIQPIDLVVVNLYPFRAAAKNFKFVTVVVNPKHYDEVAEMIAKDGCTTGKFRMQLAQEAFCHTSHYDDCIQEYLTAQLSK